MNNKIPWNKIVSVTLRRNSLVKLIDFFFLFLYLKWKYCALGRQWLSRPRVFACPDTFLQSIFRCEIDEINKSMVVFFKICLSENFNNETDRSMDAQRGYARGAWDVTATCRCREIHSLVVRTRAEAIPITFSRAGPDGVQGKPSAAGWRPNYAWVLYGESSDSLQLESLVASLIPRPSWRRSGSNEKKKKNWERNCKYHVVCIFKLLDDKFICLRDSLLFHAFANVSLCRGCINDDDDLGW